jgi:hypothetical protein
MVFCWGRAGVAANASNAAAPKRILFMSLLLQMVR